MRLAIKRHKQRVDGKRVIRHARTQRSVAVARRYEQAVGRQQSKSDSGTNRRARLAVTPHSVSTGASRSAVSRASGTKQHASRCQEAIRVRALCSGLREARPSTACSTKDGAKCRQIAPLTACGEASENSCGDRRASISRNAFGLTRSGAKTKLLARARSFSRPVARLWRGFAAAAGATSAAGRSALNGASQLCASARQ